MEQPSHDNAVPTCKYMPLASLADGRVSAFPEAMSQDVERGRWPYTQSNAKRTSEYLWRVTECSDRPEPRRYASSPAVAGDAG